MKSSKSNNDWWGELSISQKHLLQKGLDDIDKGKVLSSSEFWNKLRMAEKKGWEVVYWMQSLNNALEIVGNLPRIFSQKEVDNFYLTIADFEKNIS